MREFEEGRLEWIDPIARLPTLDIPRTDRDVIWPLVLEHSVMLNPGRARGMRGACFQCILIATDAEEGFVVTKEWPRK